jgi:CheY-like chemotaxis protein
MEVKVAKSGEKAIYLHSQGASFDPILMDMDMPAHVTSGYEV